MNIDSAAELIDTRNKTAPLGLELAITENFDGSAALTCHSLTLGLVSDDAAIRTRTEHAAVSSSHNLVEQRRHASDSFGRGPALLPDFRGSASDGRDRLFPRQVV